MAVSLERLRDELMPGLLEMRTFASYQGQWAELFDCVPKPLPIAPKVALAIGAAAAIIRNPKTSRRSLFGLPEAAQDRNIELACCAPKLGLPVPAGHFS